jgi:hypothetical protein
MRRKRAPKHNDRYPKWCASNPLKRSHKTLLEKEVKDTHYGLANEYFFEGFYKKRQ